MKKIIPFILLMLSVVLYACSSAVALPDLSGQSENNTKIMLEDLSIVAEVEYVIDQSVTDGNFVGYKDYEIGDEVDADTTITVLIAKNSYNLPDLSGEDLDSVESILNDLGVTYEIAYEYNTEITENYMFSRFDGYVAGDSINVDDTLVVYMSFDGYFLPDVIGLTEAEAIEILDYEFIQNYEFDYIYDDTKEEGIVAGYENLEAGDPAEGTVTVLLYKNSFTDAETSMFFSKYLEGENNERALEIYNPTDAAIDLSKYHISIFSNGSTELTARIQLEGTLDPGDTYIVAYKGSPQAVLDYADHQSSRLVYDGNDVIQLRYENETYIDTIYDLGNQLFMMENELFIRDENTVKGSRVYVANDWDGYVPDYYEAFGTFPFAKPESFTISTEYLYNAFGSTTVSGMIEVTPVTINDGDTIGFTPGFTNDKRVRFLGVDTPETYPSVDPWGLEAKAFTTDIVNNGTVFYLQSDPILGSSDTYGRTLAFVWVDGVMLNYELIKNGFSHNYLSTNSRIQFEHRYLYRWFQDAETYARENGLGIHS